MSVPMLLPCPFCGNPKPTITTETHGHGDTGPAISCRCGARMAPYLEGAITAWNRRAPSEQQGGTP